MSKPKPKLKLVKKPVLNKKPVARIPSKAPDIRTRMAAKKAAKRAIAKAGQQKNRIPKDL